MLFILLLFYIVEARDTCDPGSYAQSFDTCQTCPSGYFQDGEDALSCMECVETNAFSDVQGATECKQCPAGWVRSSRIACVQCADNTVREASALVCENCPLGYIRKDNTLCVECPIYATELTPCCPGSVMVDGKCSQCPLGTHIESPEDTSCTTCPIGKTSALNQDECSICDQIGYGVNETNKLCYPCPPGTFSQDGSCTPCPPSTTQILSAQIECNECIAPQIFDTSTTPCKYDHTCLEGQELVDGLCVDCPPGQIRSIFQENCTTCPQGSFEQDNICIKCPPGKDVVDNVCTDCVLGKFKLTEESCQNCAAGQYNDVAGATSCKKCEEGKYQGNTYQTTCISCESGRYRASAGGAYCSLCPLGYGSTPDKTSCELCAVGRASSNGICTDCEAGFFRPSTTFVSCIFCPGGWIANSPASDSCTLCEIGKYSTYNRIECATCPEGNVTNVNGFGATGCSDTYLQCGSGRYGDANACKECPAGWYSGNGQQSCDECPSGTFSEPNAAFCLYCENGKYSFEGTECKHCEAGQFGLKGECQLCSKGKYQTLTGQSSCFDCPVARTTENVGATDISSCVFCESSVHVISSLGDCQLCSPHEYPVNNVCTSCPPGRDNLMQQQECTKCPQGFATTSGACKACPSGFTAPAEGQSECTSCTDLSESCTGCSPGFYLTTSGCKECTVGQWSSAGQTKCSRCQRGRYINFNGQSVCKKCEAGKFMNSLGASACTLCPAGFFQQYEESASCHSCPIGRYSSIGASHLCVKCPSGSSTLAISSTSIIDCVSCPAGSYELNNVCTLCPESTYQDQVGSTECKSCVANSLSPKGATSLTQCFPIDDLKTYVFGLQGDTKKEKSFESQCELRPNSVLLCPGCTCDDDARNGYWSGPICDECRRGFATAKCTSKCPGYDGTNDESMCSGNGKCWYGMHGTGLCYCGGKQILDPSAAGVVVDVRTCPKGKICAGYGISVQTRTTYKPLYYLVQYRQFSTFVLQINKYTPDRGHMWFKRFPPSIAYENKCSSCVGPWRDTFSTEIGFWNKAGDYNIFHPEAQTKNGFHGENCQHECSLCLNGGYCNNVPHPYRRTYTIKDTFVPQRTISIPATTCICPSILYDSNHMCCPNGFQPYVFIGHRHTHPYARFTDLPHVTSMKNEQREYHFSTDLWLLQSTNDMILRGDTYRAPYYEPANGMMYISEGSDIKQVSYSSTGPYNNHIYYGTARDICRACPGLFGKGVTSRLTRIETEAEAEHFWWDNAMGAISKKCNGVGKCNFYSRERETEVEFMGSVSDYRRMFRGMKCDSQPIRTTLEETLDACIESSNGASFVAFAEPYRGGIPQDMVQNASGAGPWRTDERSTAISNSYLNQGWAEEISSGMYTIVETIPRPDTDSDYMTHPKTVGTCIHYKTCDTQTYSPEFSVFDIHVGHGAKRLADATFNRFDTCFTYDREELGTRQFGLYQTIPYENGQDPFLGSLCPKGHYCTQTANKFGYKEACPVGYYQPFEGITRTDPEIDCSSLRSSTPPDACMFNEATADPYDLVDKVCKRCRRYEWSSAGSEECSECPVGRVKKLSGNYDVAKIQMMNFPSFVIPSISPWYYIEDEYGQEVIDCALVPPGMIHIPNANTKMSYDYPNFMAVVSCPFGMTSTPGTYMYDEFTSKEVQQSFSVFKEAISPPYMTFEPVAEFTLSENKSCACVDKIVVKSKSVCSLYANKEQLQFVELPEGPDGCWTHHSHPNYVFFVSPKGLGIASGGLTNVCTEDEYRSDLMTQMIGQYCRYCPGNSMTGSESGLCTTCFANKLKIYLKEAILMIASTSYLDMVDCIGNCDTLPKNLTQREEYVIPFYAWKFRNVELDTIPVLGSCTQDIVLATLTLTDVSMTLPQCLIACSMTEVYANSDDEQPSGNQWSIVGVDEDKCICSTEIPTKDGNFWRCKDTTTTQVVWRIKKFRNQTVDTNWYSDGLPLCSTCSSGKYLSSIDASCQSCPEGRYTSNSLEANANTCLKCAAGQIAPTSNMKGCQNCPVGTYQLFTGQTECTQCAAGLYQDLVGKTSCKSCPVGYISKTNEYCEACPAGQYGSGSGASLKCVECPNGYFQSLQGQTSCTACVKGTFQDTTGSISCKECPAGKFGDTISQTSSTSCKDCVKGTFSSSSGLTSCNTCEFGKYQDTTGETSCKDCPGGSACQPDTLGQVCTTGTYAPPKQHLITCLVCTDNGKYYTNIDSTKCLLCGDNWFIKNEGSNTCESCGDKVWLKDGGRLISADDIFITSNIGVSESKSILIAEALSPSTQTIQLEFCMKKGASDAEIHVVYPVYDGNTYATTKIMFDTTCKYVDLNIEAKVPFPIAIQSFPKTAATLGFEVRGTIINPNPLSILTSYAIKKSLEPLFLLNEMTFENLQKIHLSRIEDIQKGSEQIDRYITGCII